MSNIEMMPCIICGASHRDFLGFNYHSVSCSNTDCSISSLVLTKEKWNSMYLQSPLYKEKLELIDMIKAIVSATNIDEDILDDIDLFLQKHMKVNNGKL